MGNCSNIPNQPLTVSLTAGDLGAFCHESLQTTYEKFMDETTGSIAGNVAAFTSGDDTPSSSDQNKLWYKQDTDDCNAPGRWHFYNGDTAAWEPVYTGTPIGSILMWYTSSAPADWLLCDGSAIDSGYTDLISVVGANTPDLRGRMAVGVDGGVGRVTANNALTNSSGLEDVTLTAAESGMPAHGHTMYTAQDTASHHGHQHGNRPASASTDSETTSLYTGSKGVQDASAAAAAAAHTNLPPYLVINFIIKAV